MSITSERIKKNGFIHALADEAAAEIEQLEAENAKLVEACRCFRHFVGMRGGSWGEMLEVLNSALGPDEAPVMRKPEGGAAAGLPADFLARGLKLAEECALFGIPLKELSRDELLAAAAEGWSAYNRHIAQSIERAELLRDLRRAG